MANIILSVPHTGTRFVSAFLDDMGVGYLQHHTEGSEAEKIEGLLIASPKFIIPMRDPLLNWMSHYLYYGRSVSVSRFDMIKNLTAIVLEYWFLLEYFEPKAEKEYLYLNTKGRNAELQKVADFVGSEQPITNFEWRNIGGGKGPPEDYDLWKAIKSSLTPKEVSYIMKSLLEVRKKYGYI